MRFIPSGFIFGVTVIAACLWLQACSSERSPVQTDQSQPVEQSSSAVIREAAPALSSTYAAMRKQQILSVDYGLSVVLDSQKDFFEGQVDIQFELAPENVSPITIDFNAGEIKSVTLNGKAVKWDYNQWFISLAPQLFTAGNNRLQVNYSRSYGTDGTGLHRFKDPETDEIYLYTDFEPFNANRLFPHFDQPNLKASYTLDVVAPASWQVISVTREKSVTENKDTNTRSWVFPKSARISSYVFALHAGPYYMWEDKAGDIPLRLFARQTMAKYVKTDDWFTPTQQSFAFFNEYFGLKYPFVKYDQIIVPDFNPGAMENVGAVTFREGFVSRGEKTTDSRRSLANTIAHEMAHMWFGDLVTMDWWNGLWLNESFATYMANLEMAKASDFENTWDVFYASTKQWAYQTDQLVTTHAIELPVPTTADAFTNFDGITYGKGASVLKQLSHFLGEEKFRLGVREYLKKYAYKNTSLDDFISELAKAANKDLTQWKQQWLYETGLNTIKLNFSCKNNVIESMELVQTAPDEWPTLREQRVQVGLYQSQKNRMQLTKLIPFTYRGESTKVNDAIGQACPDLAYPNVGDWGYANVQLDDRSLETLRKKINTFAEPGMRMMLWQNLWDSVRSAVLPVDEYTDFVMTNITREKEKNVVRQVSTSLSNAYRYLTKLQTQADSKTDYYQNIVKQRAEIETFAWDQLLAAKAGSDLQKQWFDIAKSASHTPVAFKRIRALLSSDLTIDGLSIDQDKRWRLIVVLNQYQYEDYKEILATEMKQDDSDIGVKMAIAAEVIRPDSAIKDKWFNIAVDSLTKADSNEKENKYKLSTVRYAMKSLFPDSQLHMKSAFREKILAVLPILARQANQAVIGSYVRILTPASCNEKSVKRLSEAVREFSELNPIVVKALKISHQKDQRCVDIGKRMQE